VVIRDEELNRIRDYVTSVPHRATGGLLLGHRYVRNDVELLVITRSTTRVPDERLDDESCPDHPRFTIADVGRALEKTGEGTFLGRWHAHLDGLNRPSGQDFQWARGFLSDASAGMECILHPIVVYAASEVTFHPYVATLETGSFQKVPWQSATADEIERIKQDRPPPVTREKEAEVGIFSLNKTRELFREEGVKVASLPSVIHSEVRDDGSHAILEVEMGLGEKRAVVHLSGDPWYPLHPPALRVQVEGRARKVSSQVLTDWTSMCTLYDVVKDTADVLDRLERGDTLAPPPVGETDPIRREIAILQAAGYRVYMTPAEKAGTLITARSTLLDGAGKVYYVILPPEWPLGTVAWAIAEEGLPLAQVQFETLDEKPPDFTLLTWFERLVPAAREERAQAAVARKRRPLSIMVGLLYIVLFLGAGVGGYLFQVSESHDLIHLWERAVVKVRDRLGLAPHETPSAKPKPPPVVLAAKRGVLVVVMDAGKGTNLPTADARWAAMTALKPVPIRVVQVDLRNTGQDLDKVLKAAPAAQALIVLTYGAGDRQADFLKTLREAVHVPVGVVSMARGAMEDVLADTSAFYVAVTGSGRAAVQRALFELRRNGALVIR
jgi:hypothetical protein